MRKLLVGAALATAAVTATAGAQEQTSIVTGHPAAFTVTPYAGYMNFGSVDAAGVRQSYDNRALVGAQAGLALSQSLSIVGNLAYARTQPTLTSAVSGARLATGGDVNQLLYDANLEYKLPLSTGVIRPFVQGGAGAVRYSAGAGSNSTNRVALNAGVGADVSLGVVGLRVMAKDYVTSPNWNGAGDVTFRGTGASRSNNLALTAGLKVGF